LSTRAASAVLIPFAIAACTAPAGPDNRAAEAAAAAAKPPAPVQAPARSVPTPAAAPAAAAPAGKPARRCGWLVNPTPGNWWLYDRDGEWILASQGSESATGMDDLPDMSTTGWVETNGHYGYGCACMTIAYEPATRRVTKVADASPRPLRQCRADRRLPRP
jgi:hypothetical protein